MAAVADDVMVAVVVDDVTNRTLSNRFNFITERRPLRGRLSFVHHAGHECMLPATG